MIQTLLPTQQIRHPDGNTHIVLSVDGDHCTLSAPLAARLASGLTEFGDVWAHIEIPGNVKWICEKCDLVESK